MKRGRAELLWMGAVGSLLGCGDADEACPDARAIACGCEGDVTAGVICTVVGTHIPGRTGEGIPALETALYLPQDVTIGPDGLVYIVDWNNNRIRVVDAANNVYTLVGTGGVGDAFDVTTGRSSGVALEVALDHPTHVLFAANGDMIVSAWYNSQVLRYVAATGLLERVCGTGRRAFNGDDKAPLETDFDLPVATAWSADGGLLISDQANQRIRVVSSDGTSVTTVVGDGVRGYSGDGGPANEARIQLPTSQTAPPAGRIASDILGQIYLADTVNHVIRKVDRAGIIETIAGTGEPGNGVNGAATACALNAPVDVAVDAAGNVYVADTMNSCVRRVDLAGQITVVAGQCGRRGYAGDGQAADHALLDRPYGVDVAADGGVWIADTHNHVIRVVHPTTQLGPTGD